MSVVSEYIASLGGYETAKDKSTPWLLNHGENWRNVKEATLLEYRREHNIYELRDKIVFIDEFMHDEVMTVSDGNNVALWMDNDTKHAVIEMVRHATDAEIKAMTRGAD